MFRRSAREGAIQTTLIGALTTTVGANTGTLGLGSASVLNGAVGGAVGLRAINVVGGSNLAGVTATITGAANTPAKHPILNRDSCGRNFVRAPVHSWHSLHLATSSISGVRSLTKRNTDDACIARIPVACNRHQETSAKRPAQTEQHLYPAMIGRPRFGQRENYRVTDACPIRLGWVKFVMLVRHP